MHFPDQGVTLTEHWGRQWERPLGIQGVREEIRGGDGKHSPPRVVYGMGETPGQGGREQKPPGTAVAVGETPGHAGGGGRDHGGR